MLAESGYRSLAAVYIDLWGCFHEIKDGWFTWQLGGCKLEAIPSWLRAMAFHDPSEAFHLAIFTFWLAAGLSGRLGLSTRCTDVSTRRDEALTWREDVSVRCEEISTCWEDTSRT